MLTNVNNMFENEYPPSAIAVDWLSLYCIGEIQNNDIYTFNLLDYSTRTFRKVYEIFYKTEKIGTCTSEPTSKIINARAIIVKFDNRLLYSRSIKFFISKFLKTCNLIFKSITRADICRDFHTLLNGIKPPNFLSDFFKQKYLKNGRARFTTIGNPGTRISYDYLKFGSRSTGKTIYMYNKSKELREQKNKPWIIDFWKLNNLFSGQDVWRLEFSFKGSQSKKVDGDTGEFTKIHWSDLFNPKKLYELMTIAIQQYFHFKINTGIQNKTEMPDLNLFADNYTSKKLVKLPDQEDETRAIRIVLKKLVAEYNDNESQNKYSLSTLSKTITEISNKYNLNRFLHQHLNFVPWKTNTVDAWLT